MSDPRKLDRSDAIEVLWPLRGPHTAESVVTASAAIAHLWRYLGHATIRSDTKGLAEPADVYLAISNLAVAGHSAAQVMSQFKQWTARVNDNPRLVHDEDLPRDLAARGVAIAGYALDTASQQFDAVTQQLYKATGILSHLYIDHDAEGGQRS
ncbi:hypothetical protein [Nocardia sp. NPDC056000]|uniref:hypothetical protein n=1 Tax=Nocardia sp. NPDC056000 TaxID=3345674 RepID=UPI0035DED940